MNKIYEENMETIKNEKIKKKIKSAKELKLIKTIEGNNTLMENGKYVHSKYFPRRTAKEIVGKIEKEEKKRKKKIIFLFGIGVGYELDEVIKIYKEEEVKIIVLEPSYNIFKTYIKNKTLKNEVNRIIIKYIIGENITEEKLLDDVLTEDNYEWSIMIKNVYTYSTYKNEYLEILRNMEKKVRQLSIQRNTKLIFSELWSRYRILNIKHNFETYHLNNIENMMKGRGGILVSAGPSLNRNIKLLKEAKGKYLIVCVYTAYKVLKINGIEPDFLVTVDAKAKLYEEDIKKGIEVPMITIDMANYEFLKHCKKVVMSVRKEDILLNESLEKRIMKVKELSGTQASLGFLFLNKIKCNPIIMIGQDLSFESEVGATHAKGTFYEGDKNKKETFKIKGNYKEYVYTDKILNSYLEWFNYICKELKDEVKVINATEGGAFIDNTEVITLREVLDRYNQEDNVEDIVNKFCENDKIFKTTKEKREYYNYLKKVREDIYNLNTVIRKNVYLAEDMVKHANSTKVLTAKKIKRLLNNLDENDKKIKKEKKIYNIFENALNNQMYYIEGKDYIDKTEDEKIASETRDFYKLMNKVGNDMYDNFGILLENVNEKYRFE